MNLFQLKNDFNSGEVDTVRLLIVKGARIDAKDNHGSTPLDVASLQGNSLKPHYKTHLTQ